MLLVISCGMICLFTLLVIFLIRRRASLSSKPQTRVIKPTYIFRRSQEVSYKKIHFGAKLAEGSYGRFYQAKLEEDGVVVKRFEGDWGDKSTDVERDVLLRIGEFLNLSFTTTRHSLRVAQVRYTVCTTVIVLECLTSVTFFHS